jgi:hypothetical protein
MMDDQKWTPKMVASRFYEAADTVHRLPNTGLKPQGYKSSWPEFIRDTCDGDNDNTVMRLGPPTADAISRMDECLEWLRWLEPEESKLIWLRAERKQWKVIMRHIGLSRAAAFARWMAALMQVTAILNIFQKKMSRHLSTRHFVQNLT